MKLGKNFILDNIVFVRRDMMGCLHRSFTDNANKLGTLVNTHPFIITCLDCDENWGDLELFQESRIESLELELEIAHSLLESRPKIWNCNTPGYVEWSKKVEERMNQ